MCVWWGGGGGLLLHLSVSLSVFVLLQLADDEPKPVTDLTIQASPGKKPSLCVVTVMHACIGTVCVVW